MQFMRILKIRGRQSFPTKRTKTGDPVKPIIPIALGIIAAAGIVVMIVLKKKYK